jgi:hypothetical protein
MQYERLRIPPEPEALLPYFPRRAIPPARRYSDSDYVGVGNTRRWYQNGSGTPWGSHTLM